MVDWVHCNICYRQVGQHKKFAISNCGHIYCSECINKAPNQCRICKKEATFVELSTQMSPQYEIYFISPAELAQRHLNELKRVIDFQNRNRFQLIKHIKQKVDVANQISDEYNQLKQSLKKMESDVQDLEEKYRSTLKENSYLKRLVESNKSPSQINLDSGACKMPSSFVLNTPSSQTPPNNRRLSSGLNKNDANSARVISPSRISAISPPVDGRIGLTPSRINMGNPSYGITPRSVSASTSRLSYPSMVTSPSYQNTPSPMEFSTPNSMFNRFGLGSRGRMVPPRRLITADSFKNI